MEISSAFSVMDSTILGFLSDIFDFRKLCFFFPTLYELMVIRCAAVVGKLFDKSIGFGPIF